MEHHFNIQIAKEYGILEAVILNNLQFWISKNIANNANYYDGSYWTYNSVKAFQDLFPYASQKQIRAVLKKLVDMGILKTGNYNKSSYDRTLWYAFTDKGLSICPLGQMEYAKMVNGIDQQGKPIPYNKPNKKPDNKPDKEYDHEFLDEVWNEYPRKQGKEKALQAYIKARKDGVDKDIILAGIRAYKAFITANRTDSKYIKQGSTWFNQKCWEDDYNIDPAAITSKLTSTDFDYLDEMEEERTKQALKLYGKE